MPKIIDSHFHWYPRAVFEKLCGEPGYPRAERMGDSYAYWHSEASKRASKRATSESDRGLSQAWLNLELGLEVAQSVHGDDCAVIGTSGILEGLFGQLLRPANAGIFSAYNEGLRSRIWASWGSICRRWSGKNSPTAGGWKHGSTVSSEWACR
jgi:aminocarboxymuconate-semialdehyde decarboxylase